MKSRALQRCCLSVMACVLLLAQMPWAHAMPQASAAVADVVADPPCHGADATAGSALQQEPAAPEHSQTGSDGCCGGVHCEDHCAQPAWALSGEVAPATMFRRLAVPAMMAPPSPVLRQPELLRPPI